MMTRREAILSGAAVLAAAGVARNARGAEGEQKAPVAGAAPSGMRTFMPSIMHVPQVLVQWIVNSGSVGEEK